MTRDVQAYRLLLRLYPRAFRAELDEDLVQLFRDLVRRDGRRGAWLRCLADLAVSVPRLRLEAVVNPSTVHPVLVTSAVLLATAGVAAVALGGAAGLPLLVLAALLAAAQRSRLSRALAVPPDRRQHRLRAAALLGAVFAASVISWLVQVGREDSLSTVNVLAHNVVGMASLAGAVCCLAAGLLSRPRT